MIDITQILIAVLQLAITVIVTFGCYVIKTYVMPWLKAKFSQEELSAMQQFIEGMIKAAEQMESNGIFDAFEDINAAKKEYVVAAVKKYCEERNFTFDEDQISDAIEGLIRDVKDSQELDYV